MKLFLAYLKTQRKSILLFTSFFFIFCVVFYSHAYALDAVIYASVLCAFFGLVIFMAGYYCFYRKYQQLRDLEHNICLSIMDLPQAKDELEVKYQNMVRQLFYKMQKLELERTEIEKEITDYYTLWAHQIKTPIAAMGLLFQTQKVNEETFQLEEQLFKIEQYVEMVLQYIRTESTSTDYEIKKYNLDKIVRQSVRKFSRLFIRKKIKMEYTPIIGSVVTDEKWLSFVIDQLLSNALKYTREEGTIRIYQDENAWTTIIIEDTGIGIELEDLPRVFEKGYTGYNGRIDKKSTGVGLYLCKQIMTRLGHGIRVESAENQGTRVFLDLYAKQRTD